MIATDSSKQPLVFLTIVLLAIGVTAFTASLSGCCLIDSDGTDGSTGTDGGDDTDGIDDEPEMSEGVYVAHEGDITEPEAVAFPEQSGEVATGYIDGVSVTYELIGDKVVYDFDIVKDATEVSDLPPFTRGAAREKTTVYWPNRIVYYRFADDFTNTSNLVTAIRYYIDLGFDFVERTNESNYIEFFYLNDDEGYWSSDLGMAGGRQRIHLASDYGVGTAIHEIGHAIGLYHENSRSDRDAFLEIDWDNILSGKDHNFETYDERGYDGFDYHNFDWLSIMLYPSFAFCVDTSIPTIIKLDGSSYGTQSIRFSAGDIRTVYEMYPHTDPVWTDTVAPDSGNVSVIQVDGNGGIYIAHSDEDYFSGAWNGWGTILNGFTVPGGQLSLVSRYEYNLDAFVSGTDGRVYTAAWDSTVGGGWRGWWQIGELTTIPGTHVSVTVRDPDKLDIFAVGEDGGIYTAAWDQYVDEGVWRGWWHIQDGIALCGTDVWAVTRAADKLDIFAVGLDGDVWTAAWHQDTADGAWQGWWSLGSAGQGITTVSAVVSDEERIHVFAVRLDGQIHSNEWDPAEGGWSGWQRIGNVTASPGARVDPVSRQDGYVDIFVLGNDQQVYSAAWEYGRDARNTYRGWWNLGTSASTGGTVAPSPATQVSAAAKDANSLDVFMVNGYNVYHSYWPDSADGWSSWQVVTDYVIE